MGLRVLLDSAEELAPKSGSFWVGKGLTLADTSMFCTLRQFTEIKASCLAGYPKLTTFVEEFSKRPPIAAYLVSDRRVPLTRNCLAQGPYTRDSHYSAYVQPLK